MKRSILVLLCVAVALLGASSAMAYTIGNGVPNSPHDLHTTYPSQTGTTEVCIFCHTPHSAYLLSPGANGGQPGVGPVADPAYNYLPLWNHLLPSPAPTYSLYWNGPGAPQDPSNPKTSQAIILTTGKFAPGGTSMLCLSCHDGKISVNSYGNTNQPAAMQSYITNNGTTINPNYIIGGLYNLQNHHPIAFSMDTVRTMGDNAIDNPDTINYNTGDPVRNHLYGDAVACGAGTNCMVECGTCHSVHNTGNSGETLLWTTNAGSGMCLTCHIKGPLPTPGTIPAVR